MIQCCVVVSLSPWDVTRLCFWNNTLRIAKKDCWLVIDMVSSVQLSTMHFKEDERAEGAFAGLFDLEMCFMRAESCICWPRVCLTLLSGFQLSTWIFSQCGENWQWPMLSSHHLHRLNKQTNHPASPLEEHAEQPLFFFSFWPLSFFSVILWLWIVCERICKGKVSCQTCGRPA